jgi:predicted peptidoglycan binding protein
MRDLGCPLSAASVQQKKGDQQRCQDGTGKTYSVREEKEHAAQRATSSAVPSKDGWDWSRVGTQAARRTSASPSLTIASTSIQRHRGRRPAHVRRYGEENLSSEVLGHPHCDDLPPGVDYIVFDYGVNSGIGRSGKVLQRLLGVPVDGVIGPQTLAAAKAADPSKLVDALCDERLAFLKSLKTWPVFAGAVE